MFLIVGNAGFIPSTVGLGVWALVKELPLSYHTRGHLWSFGQPERNGA